MQTTKKIDQRIIDQFNERAPFKWENATLLILAQVGSHSHNTFIQSDDLNAVQDIDFMGVIIPPMSFTLGMKNWENLAFQFEELDCTFYSFRKFIGLLAKGNPNVLGLLYLNPKNRIFTHSVWQHVIMEHRDAFLNKQLTFNSFVGYSREQLKKMTSFDLKTQQEWELALRLIEAAGWTKEGIIKKHSLPMIDQAAVINAYIQYCKENDIEILMGPGVLALAELSKAPDKIRTIHARHFQGYMGDKRKNLVRKHGYDTKNAAHLIRLMRMCNEYLTTGELHVWRTVDADEIRAIKTGKWTLDEVRAEAERLFEEANKLYETSSLPELPNLDAIDELCIEVYLEAYGLDRQ